LAQTLTDAKAVLEKAFTEMEGIRQKDIAQQQQANAGMKDNELKTKLQISREDREDRQVNEKDNIILQGDTDIRVNNSTSSVDHQNKMIVDQNKMEQEHLNSKSSSM
jgi:hypothetical protein